LGRKIKLGFINDSCKCSDDTSLDLTHWIQCENIVMSWILNSTISKIAESFMCTEPQKTFVIK